MGNIGASETYVGYLVKSANWAEVDSLLKDTSINVAYQQSNYIQRFRFRYLSQEESTMQQLRGWLKGGFSAVIFSSETELSPKERDRVLFEDGTSLIVMQQKPLTSNGMFALSKKPPHVMVLQ